jgi:CBS domain containing-hemolysin-like protein
MMEAGSSGMFEMGHVLTAVAAYVLAMLLIGLLAAFFRVSGLARYGLLEPEAVGGVLARLLAEPRRFILTVGTLYLAATGIGCVATASALAAAWPGLAGTRFYLAVGLLVVLAWSLGGVLVKLAAGGAALGYTRFLGRVLSPVTWLLRPWTALLNRAAGPIDDTQWSVEAMPHLSTGEIRSLIEEEDDDVNLEEDEREMIQSIFGFHETAVKEIMVPRIDVVTLDASTPVSEALPVVAECRHSRIPLHEGNVDKVTGLLYAKDLLSLADSGGLDTEGKVLGDLARPAYFVPESKKLDQVLAEFRAKRIHLAVVIDEYGGTAGVVTLEDVLEEIVGEIEDEFDVAEELHQWLDECTLRVDPKIDLEDLRDLLGVDLPLDEGSETLAGLIYEAAGKVPAAGDRAEVAGLDVVVEQVEDQRILRVRVIAETPFPGYGARKDES